MITTAPPPTPVKEPWLFRLALKYTVREVRNHPHTLAAIAVAFLSHDVPLPRSTPVLFAFALEALKRQAEMHPHTLLARAVEELRKAAEIATTVST
jgi:hypothetical protein